MAGNVRVNITADGSGFNRTMSSIENRVSSFGSSLKSKLAGAFSVAAVGAFARSMSSYAGAMKDASARLDMTRDKIQALQLISEDAGVNFANLEGMLDRINDVKNAAMEGDIKAMNIFDKIGLTGVEVEAMDSLELLQEIAKIMTRLSPTERKALPLADLIGIKDVGRLNSMASDLANFTDKVEEFRNKFLILGDETGDAWDKFNKRVDKGTRAIKNITGTVGNWMLSYSKLGLFGKLIGKVQDSFLQKPEAPNIDSLKNARETHKLLSIDATIWDLLDEWSKPTVKPPKKEEPIKPEEIARNAYQIGSDPLVSIGNFLGSSTNSLRAATRQTNEHLADIKRILTAIKNRDTLRAPEMRIIG